MGNYRNFKLVYYFVAQGTVRAQREKLEKDIGFFERYMRPDKVYLEPFRSGILADEEQVELCREVFEKHGVEVAGGLTTTIPTPAGGEAKQRMFETFCYNDGKMLEKLHEACAFIGRISMSSSLMTFSLPTAPVKTAAGEGPNTTGSTGLRTAAGKRTGCT